MRDEDFIFPITLAYECSKEAVILYAYIVDMASKNGECRSVVEAGHRAAMDYERIIECAAELDNAGFIESYETETPIAEHPGHWIVMGKILSARPIRAPKRVDRLSPAGWSKVRNKVFKRDDYTCTYCGTRGVKLECDHVIPIASGGTNELGNLTTACHACNKAKRDKLIEEWRVAS